MDYQTTLDEPEPDLPLVARHQRAAGLYDDIPIEQPGPERRSCARLGHVEGHRLQSRSHLCTLGRSPCRAPPSLGI